MSERDELDRYWTPPWCTRALLEWLEKLGCPLVGPVLEPCAGANGITDVLRAAGMQVITGDFDGGSVARYSHDYCWDFADPSTADDLEALDLKPTAVVSNPPFILATPIVRNAIRVAPTMTAILLRCTFGEPCVEFKEPWLGRHELFDVDPPSLMLWLPRPSFGRPRGSYRGSTDSATCCWFVWGLPIEPTLTKWVHPRDVKRLMGQTSLFPTEEPC